jgi:hypothetical protein
VRGGGRATPDPACARSRPVGQRTALINQPEIYDRYLGEFHFPLEPSRDEERDFRSLIASG